MAYLSQSIGCWAPWPLRSPFAPSKPWGKSWSIRRTPSQNGREKMWCTAFPAMSVHEPTLDKLAGHWTTALHNIGGLSGVGMWRPQHWQSMCLLLGTKWIYLRQQWSMLTLMPKPAAFLSPGTSSTDRPLSTGEGEPCQDSMPPCWTDIFLCFYFIFCLTLHLILAFNHVHV